MLDKDTLLSRKTFPDPDQVEKDYLQHIILKSMYEKVSEKVVFKGGTALQKVYALDRFSEDLDFTLNGEVMPEIEKGLANLSNYAEIMNNLDDDRIVRGGVTNFPILLMGPLAMRKVTVDIVHEATTLKPLLKLVKSPYPDLQPYLVYVMDEKEILAEKIRALVGRKQKKERDLYDLYFLLKKGIDIDINLVYSKFKFVGKKISVKQLGESVESMKEGWPGLNKYVTELPKYETVANFVRDKFNNIIWV